MQRIATAALAGVCVLACAVAAQEGGAKKPLGTWTRTVNENSVEFVFQGEQLQCLLRGKGASIKVYADYGVTRDGVVFGRVHKVEQEGTEAGPKEGSLFSFRVAVKGETLTVSDLGPEGGGTAQLIEGDYTKAAAKAPAK